MDAPSATGGGDRGLSLPVLGGGLITGGLALLGVWALGRASDDANIMGWYANYVIPIGAILVGLVAGLGYGLAAWWMDRRVNNVMLCAIVLLQVGVYLAAQYVEYRELGPQWDDGTPVGFWEYFDIMTRAFAFKEKHGDGYGAEMGAWGYAFRGLEMAGFAFGGLIAPLILRALPYCQHCGLYMKTRQLGIVPAGPRPQTFRKDDEAGRENYARDEAQLMAEGLATVQELVHFAAHGQLDALHERMAPYAGARKENEKLSARLHVSASECRQCGNGALNVVIHRGHGNKASQAPVGSFPLVLQPPPDDPSAGEPPAG